MTLTHVAVDPGASAGVVAFEGLEPVSVDRFRGVGPVLAAQVLRRLKPAFGDGEPVLVIESQFGGSNIQSTMRIVEARMVWQVLAEVFGWRVETVAPNSWQSWHGLAGRMQRKERKARAKVIAAGLWPHTRLSEDEADALLMGRGWWERNGREG